MGWPTTTMSVWTAESDTTLYPIKAVIAFRNAKWHWHSTRRLHEWCEMAAVPVSARPLAEPYKKWRYLCDDPLPDDPLLKLAVLVLQMRASERYNSERETFWYDAWHSAEKAEREGIKEVPLCPEPFETWKARKQAAPAVVAIL